ncbi:MAG: asparagine synthase-related protein [Thermoanaerobaculia bacterium]
MLIGTRDPFGTRPFYYARTANALVHSESLETVLSHPDVSLELDEAAVADYLAVGVYSNPEATIYANVRRLPPGHTLHSDRIERYWTVPPRNPKPRRDAVAHLEAALRQAIADRVNGPSAVVFMSGGLDSTLLAALTREVRPDTQLLAGTSVYRSRIADVEEPFAEEAARSIGIPIRKFVLDDYPPLQALDADVWTADPGPMYTAPMARDIYRQAAEHASIALHGHPADAVLSIDLRAYLRSLPASKRIAEMIRYTIARRRPPYFFFRPQRAAVPKSIPDWLRVRGVTRQHSDDPLASPAWSCYFEWAHPQFTQAPIEVVYPWCDVRVIEAARELEPIPWLVDKHITREMLRGRVSERVRRRKKSFLAGDPWRAEVPDFEIEAASRFIDPARFREACRAAGFLSDQTLRAVVFESWLRKLPAAIARLRT